MWKQAKLAAVWSLNKALHSDMDFFTLCNAYANMIQVAHHYGNQGICIALEVHALRLCHRKKTNVEPQELKGVAKLYGTIFCARLVRVEGGRILSSLKLPILNRKSLTFKRLI